MDSRDDNPLDCKQDAWCVVRMMSWTGYAVARLTVSLIDRAPVYLFTMMALIVGSINNGWTQSWWMNQSALGSSTLTKHKTQSELSVCFRNSVSLPTYPRKSRNTVAEVHHRLNQCLPSTW